VLKCLSASYVHRTHVHRTHKHSSSSAARLPRSNATTRTHLHPYQPRRRQLFRLSTKSGSKTQAAQRTRTRARTHDSTHAHLHLARQTLPSTKRTHVRTYATKRPSKVIPAYLCSCLAQSLTPQPKPLLLDALTQRVAPPAPTLAAPTSTRVMATTLQAAGPSRYAGHHIKSNNNDTFVRSE